MDVIKAFVDEMLSQPLDVVISKLLGYAIIAGSLMLKLPQIAIILRTKDVKQVSKTMFYLEVTCYTIAVAYAFHNNFPFNTYGETVFILIQDFIIVFLLHHYSNSLNGVFFASAAGYAAVCYAFYTGLVPDTVLTQLQALVVPLSVSSRVPQIISNFKTKNTGSLSFISFFLTFAGALARVFTTLKLVSDTIVLVGYILSCVLNGLITLQIVYYSYVSPPTSSSRAAGGKKTPPKKTQ
eukprot:TRINITY_DN7473_c0_g1_i1.p1 TRINITY_DN7473_c0_g1~~TRINITY_DN7473_c0_g1_i1.p1  ORF type:complete len:269 (-),score=77.08 TRINITY_DN7473_c0_g1_i1:194-907(-)